MFYDMFGNVRLKVGLHIHTTISDGRKTPEEAARIYKAAGFDTVAFTDHWKYSSEQELEGLKILSGCEYNLGGKDTAVDVMHIVGVGMAEDPQVDRQTATRQQTIDAIQKKGGIAILAHPAWSLNTPAHAMALNGFDAVEIYNTVSDVNQSSRPYSGYFVDLLANEGVSYPLVAADDVHYYAGEDETKSYIMVKASENTRECILQAIRDGEFYATQGPELHMRIEGEKVIVDCSPCVKIDVLTNSSWCPDKITRGSGLTHAEYTIKDWDKWVRVEVLDEEGNYAWSNIIML